MNDKLPLQERVRIFNLGTPTERHRDTHQLVNDLWRAVGRRLATLEQISRMRLMPDDKVNRINLHAAIEIAKEDLYAAAVADRPAADKGAA